MTAFMVPPETGSYWIKDHVNEKKKATTSTTTNQTQILHKGKEKQLKKKKVNLFLVFHVAKVYNNIK